MRFARRFAAFSLLAFVQPDDALHEPIINSICSIEGDGGGGGGGGEPPPAGGDPPAAVTLEQVQQLIQTSVNSAVTSQLTRAMDKQMTPVNASLKAIQDGLKALEKPPAPAEKPKEQDPETLALKAQLEEFKAANAESERKRVAAEEKQRDQATYGQLRDLLKDKVKPEMVDFVAKNLFYADKLVTYDDEGRALFKARRAPVAGMAEEDVKLTLGDGVAHYLKSKEAQVFLPAPAPKKGEAPRAGARFDQRGAPVYDKPATSDAEKAQRALEREQAYARQQEP